MSNPAKSSNAKDTLRFAGYAALFNIPDGARDTIVPGAFAKSLAERKQQIPLFWQHRPDQPIGVVETAEEDARGLRIIARIDNPHSRAAKMLEQQEVSGLSFGYRARGFYRKETGRILAEVDLFEVSLVTNPLQHAARVHLIA